MARRKPPILSKEEKVAMIEQSGETARELVRGISKVADRVVQASLSSPYYSVSAVALLSAMMVRGKLIAPETSMIVTGAGLALLGANTISETVPLISGMSSGAYIDNEYDQQAVSPWAPEPNVVLDSQLEDYLRTVSQ